MRLFLKALSGLCLLAAAAPAPPAKAAEPEAIEQARAAIESIRSGAPGCTLGADQAVRYIGPTDDDLLACLSEYARDGRSLTVSSGGGDALKAIAAGNALARLGWSVRVVGMCASSCGNYLIPVATSVTVDPYSAILLHGGPVDSEEFIREVQDQVEAKQRAAYPTVTDDRVAEGRAMMRPVATRAIAEHRQFSEHYAVATEWFALSEFSVPPGGFTPSDFAVVDPEYFSEQLPRVVKDRYWFPRSAEEQAEMAALVQDAKLFYRP